MNSIRDILDMICTEVVESESFVYQGDPSDLPVIKLEEPIVVYDKKNGEYK